APVRPAGPEAVATADVIAFGPGSFFTSILPHLLVDGVAAAVAANRRARKLFLANLVECNETLGRPLDDLLGVFASAAEERGLTLADLVGEIHVDRQPFPAGKTTNGHAYLAHGAAARLAA
ncbi:YvcK family protein, partial [Mycobacterium tuberculosis]|nr:YvcK family protein [Mycobacterium tuberculosis]